MVAAAVEQLGAGEAQVEAAGADGAQSPPGLCCALRLAALVLDGQLQGRGHLVTSGHVPPPVLHCCIWDGCFEEVVFLEEHCVDLVRA